MPVQFSAKYLKENYPMIQRFAFRDFRQFPYQLFGFLRFARDRNVKSVNKYESSDVFGLDCPKN